MGWSRAALARKVNSSTTLLQLSVSGQWIDLPAAHPGSLGLAGLHLDEPRTNGLKVWVKLPTLGNLDTRRSPPGLST